MKVPDLFLVNGVERGIVWLQSWTGVSIGTVDRWTLAAYWVLWSINGGFKSVWLILPLLVFGAIICLLNERRVEYLDEKQRIADDLNLVVPSYSKHDSACSWLRIALNLNMTLVFAVLTGSRHMWPIGLVGGLFYSVNIYCHNVDIWPRTGNKLRDLLKRLRGALGPKLNPIPVPSQ